ncbi:hypothetical protein CU102_26985 [Phyllobacterium brassicacearum]|uniref:Cytochrome c-552/4 domain-containing protein n=1 Tax=Phyllobacterium brassicacearum TaxID=314235 RepID=A0A2P7B4P8_9HYPH|nr:hypothetical protein CU102_26985 [Phyllobacterium brassicacearum]TDQ13477.1 cytochrome c554/c'-like protein [Phyllobacterium brassicacearum]
MIFVRSAILWAAFSLWCLLALAGQAVAAETAHAADSLISIHDGFVNETKCASCHADQAAAFAKSHHAKAMAVVDDKSVRASAERNCPVGGCHAKDKLTSCKLGGSVANFDKGVARTRLSVFR